MSRNPSISSSVTREIVTASGCSAPTLEDTPGMASTIMLCLDVEIVAGLRRKTVVIESYPEEVGWIESRAAKRLATTGHVPSPVLPSYRSRTIALVVSQYVSFAVARSPTGTDWKIRPAATKTSCVARGLQKKLVSASLSGAMCPLQLTARPIITRSKSFK